MKFLRQLIDRLLFADTTPLATRKLNIVYLAGMAGVIASIAARYFMGASWTLLGVLFIVVLSICLSMYICNRYRAYTVCTIITVVSICYILLPAAFFYLGGVTGTMASYFILGIVIIFLLVQGWYRALFALLHLVLVGACYFTNMLYPDKIAELSGSYEYLDKIKYADNLLAYVVIGFCICTIIAFQNKLHEDELCKMTRNRELLMMVNEAANLMPATDAENFVDTLMGIMEKLAAYLDIDRVYIWCLDERDGEHIYRQQYGWLSKRADKSTTLESVYNVTWVKRVPEWDNAFNKRKYISLTSNEFTGVVREQFASCGVKSIMAFPVFLSDQYWGFVSFDNCHNEKLCSEMDLDILQSISLLFANAIERHEYLMQIGKRLEQQQLMSAISGSFLLKAPMGDLIQNALTRTGEFLGVDRISVTVFDSITEAGGAAYAWEKDPKRESGARRQWFGGVIKERFGKQDGNGDAASIYCENTLTYENGAFSALYHEEGVKSFICVPIYVDKALWGAINVDLFMEFRVWSESDIQLANMVSNTLSSAVSFDIMEQARASALEQAIEASRAKGNFLSNMSHEMRTPMTAIVGMTAIGRSAKSVEKKDYSFDRINDASKHLLGVINDILDMSKIEANKLELSDISFSFTKMLQKVVDVISFRADERKQQIHVDVAENMPNALIGDDQRLAQVITNLLSNAVKFTPEGGAIYLDAKVAEEREGMYRLLVSVTDTGIGITDEQKARLFQSFEQAETGTSRKFGGTGLGLAISKRIVELMNGNIWVDSVPGKGSTFTFYVWLRQDLKKRERLLDMNVNWQNIRVFVVDDEQGMRDFFGNVFASLDICCTVAASGEEAMRLLSQDNNFSIYFLDWNLPGVNGLELSRYIRANASQKSVIVIFSSVDWRHIEEEAREAGVDKFLQKPLFPSTITDLISECIGVEDTTKKREMLAKGDNFTDKVILLAEDVAINREIVMSLLEDTHISIECAENGEEAHRMFAEQPDRYDLILMDLQMPKMDGYESARRIREYDFPKAKTIPVIAMTANVFREDIEKCFAAGMNGHIGKPIDIEDLFAVLEKYLN